jgi:PAS domain S-box-containing protein
MTYKIAELIDVAGFQRLVDLFSRLTGVVTALLDVEGTIITASGWQDVCVRFHRANPQTARRCLESDTLLASRVARGRRSTVYKCKNGLTDVAVPVFVDGAHVANLFTGQFFTEPPDLAFFRNQARAYGFADEDYIRAVEAASVMTGETLQTIIDYISEFAEMIGGMATQRLRQMEAREATEKGRTLLRAIVEGTTDAVYVKDAQGRYLLFNRAAEQAVGKKAGDVLGRDDTVCFPPDEARALMEDDRRTMDAGVTCTREEVLTTASGEVTFLTTKGVLRDASGKVDGLFGIARNITERKRMEDHLVRARAQWERTFDSMPALMLLLDKDHRVVRVNEAMKRRVGRPAEECVGLSCWEILHGRSRPPDDCAWLEALEEGRGHTVEVHNEWLGGDFIVSATPLFDGSGTVLMARDVTERTRAERIMQARLRLLEFANTHTMEDFLTAVLDELEALTDSSVGFCHFLGADQRTVSLQAWSTNTTKAMCTAASNERHYDISRAGVWADCVRERRPRIHDDYASLPKRKGMPEGHNPDRARACRAHLPGQAGSWRSSAWATRRRPTPASTSTR